MHNMRTTMGIPWCMKFRCTPLGKKSNWSGSTINGWIWLYRVYPPPPPKKRKKKKKEEEKGNSPFDFRNLDIRKYSIFWFHQIKHCLLKKKKKMIPRLFDLVRKYWFYNHFLKHSNLRILWNPRELFTAGIAVHNVFFFFCTDQWVSGQQCIKGERQKCHYPWMKCHVNEEKIDTDKVLRNDHIIKTTQPISMILVSFFSEIKNAIFSSIKVTKIERSA